MNDRIPLLLDMFGPVMIGPSSSHTAGVARKAFAARRLLGAVPRKAVIRFFGSLSSTWRGHGSDKAALAGLLVAEVDGSVSLPVVEALGLVSAVRQVVHIPSIRG